MLNFTRKIYRHFFKDNRRGFPYGIRIGENSQIGQPQKIEGEKNIKIGFNTFIGGSSWLMALESHLDKKYSPNIEIGNNICIGNNVCITCIDQITIEDGCLLSEYVYISDHGHGMDPDNGFIVNQNLVSKGQVRIGANTFIGFRACILPGVTLGEHCIVGANSVVTKSFPSYSMVAGVPARVIKIYSREKKEWVSVS